MIIVDSYKYKKRFLLDRFPAVVAYSLRQIKAGVTNVVRVRRSGDNTEQDFTATQITDGTLTTFCGAGNGFVTTWYDQSGNGYNVTQSIQASQPQIVASGVLVTTNGEPAFDFGAGKHLSNSSIPMATLFPSQATVFRVIYINNDSSYSTLGEYADHWDAFGGVAPNSNASGYIGVFANPRISNFPTGTIPTNGIHLVTYIASTQYSVFYNGVSKGTSAYTYNSMNGTGIRIGNSSVDQLNKGLKNGSTIQEVIFYNTDQTANRTAIETDINTYYSIY